MRNSNILDIIISNIHKATETLFVDKRLHNRINPANDISESNLDNKQKKHICALMRINHSGEICAQALYQGQALTAKLPKIAKQMQTAADEEIDHLAWCEQRISELEGRTSYLNIFWYTNSFLIGAVAGFIGDKWSLGFVAETENQVCNHLDSHIKQIDKNDMKTLAILKQMYSDEASHAFIAKEAGAAELPLIIKTIMKNCAKIMIVVTYNI